jgi:hypothetical protein
MPSRALNYVEKVGLVEEKDYPYKAVAGNCAVKSGAYKNKKHVSVKASEEGLVGALAV